MTKAFGLFSWYHRVWRTSGVPDFIMFQRYSDKTFKNDKILSLGPKMSIETNIFMKSCFHDDKSFWPNFPPYIACQKPQLLGFHKLIWQTLWNLQKPFLGPKTLLEKQCFEKLQPFQRSWKGLWLDFSRFIEHKKWQGTHYKGPQCVLTMIVQMIRTFLWHPRGR